MDRQVVLPVPPFWAITAIVCIACGTGPSRSRSGAPGKGRGRCHNLTLPDQLAVQSGPRWVELGGNPEWTDPAVCLSPGELRGIVKARSY